MKAPSEHERLMRVFGLPPTRLKFAAWTTAGTAFVGLFAPGALLITGGIVVGLGGLRVGDHRAVKRGLRELDKWGFTVDGYRAWLLAEHPTLELELARDVDTDVLVAAARAIDESIQIVRTRERTFRVGTRRAALPSPVKDGAVAYVGDRQLLHELHARLFAPLHADVGIRRMRMGDANTLGSGPPLLPAPVEVETGGMGAFRESAMAAPPALQALVQVTNRELPREARTLRDRAKRVVYATGSAPHGAGTVLGFTAGGAFSGAGWFHLIGMGVGAALGVVAGTAAAIQGNRRNARRIAESVDGHGFPIDGYDDWLISGRPLLDIELRSAIDPASLVALLDMLPRAFSVSANAEVAWVEEVQWLDDRTVRLETRPTLVEPPGNVSPFYGGSHDMFRTFLAQVLAPLQARVGITAVHMGGYLTRRV